MRVSTVERLGQETTNYLVVFGDFWHFVGRTVLWIFSGGLRWKTLRLLFPQMYEVGVRSVPVVALTGTFIGMVMAIESYASFKALGQESRMGSVINISVVKQIGPVLAAVMLAGRVGGALTAELGTMNVTEQLDAMRVMGADPIRYLVVPRFLACVLLTPVLTIYSDLLGVLGGWVISVNYLGVANSPYWEFSAHAVDNWEIFEGVFKSVFFGGSIGLIACYKGFTSGAGASGVGRACTESFVYSFIAIIVLNFFFAQMLTNLYHAIYGIRGVGSDRFPATMALIELRDLHKRFGRLTVLNGVSISVPEGQSLVVLGPSGTGKSVLLKHLVGLLGPDSGEVWFDGKRVDGRPERELIPIRQQFGFLFQMGALFDSLNVEDNIAFPLLEHTSMGPAEIHKVVQRKLELVGLPETRKKMPAELSGGQRKRGRTARAIAMDPRVILYDEPTTGLDPIRADIINELMLKLKRELKVTSVIVTHDMHSAFKVADRLVMLNQGKIIFDGTPDEIRRADDPVVRSFVRGEASAQDLETLHRSID